MEYKGLTIEDNGRENVITIDEGCLFQKSRIIVNGDRNHILLSKTLRYSNLIINLKGDNKKIEIGKSKKFINGLKIVSIRGDFQRVSIGENFSCGGIEIQMNDGNENLTIGNDCLFSWGIKARTSDGHSVVDLETEKAINVPKDITIADRVWVGEDVAFLKGSSVSVDSVVGSFSLITKQFKKSNVVIAGSPARIVRENISWDRRKPGEFNGVG